jgi:OOP family OmpA-OmpF porin
MKKATIASLAGAVALAASQAALAQDAGWYLGGSIGQATAQDWCNGVGPGVSCEDSDTAWRIFGGYQVNRNFAVEAGYHDLGSATASTGSVRLNADATALELVGIGMLPLAERFSVYGKLGVYAGSTDWNVSVPALGLSQGGSEDTTDLTYGLGLRYDINRQVALRGEWQRYTNMGNKDTIGETDVDVVSIGVLWKF